MANSPEIRQNSLGLVAVGSSIVGLPLVGFPIFISTTVVNAFSIHPLSIINALLCGVLTGTAGQFITQVIKRPLERKRNRSVVHGVIPTLSEVLPSSAICSLICWYSFGSLDWLYLGAASGIIGIIPLLIITRPWSEGYSEDEYQARNENFKNTLHNEFEGVREDIRRKKIKKYYDLD